MKQLFSATILTLSAGLSAHTHASTTQLLWGDTHLHTSYSMDAYLFNNRTADPDTATGSPKACP